jgi:ketosteroid isomerase-like protein
MDLTGATPISGGPLSAIVAAYYSSIDSREIEKALSCFAPNAVYRRPGYKAFVGLAAISAFYRDGRVIKSGRHVIETMIESAREVAVRGDFQGALCTGQQIEVQFADFWRFSDRVVVERNTYFDAPAV